MPATRGSGGLISCSSATNSRSGPSRLLRLALTIALPRCQVVMSVYTPPAMTSASQPPCCTLLRFAARNVPSIGTSTAAPTASFHAGHCQCRRATAKKSAVVIRNVPLTATP